MPRLVNNRMPTNPLSPLSGSSSGPPDGKEFFLATTALEEFWDTTKPIIFLGRQCTRQSRRDYWQPLKGIVMPEIWADKAFFIESYHEIERLYRRILPRLAGTLNRIHRQTFSDRYWDIVAGPWLLHYVSVLYDRYHAVHAVLQKYPDITTIGLSADCMEPLEDTHAFTQAVTTDFYNLYIYSCVFQEIGINVSLRNPKTIPSFPPRTSKKPPVKEFILNKLLLPLALRYCRRRRDVSVLLHTYFPVFEELLLSLKSGGRLVPLYPYEGYGRSVPIDRKLRVEVGEALNDTDGSDAVYRVLTRLLPVFLPRTLLEGYSRLRQTEKDFPELPRSIVTVINMHHPDHVKHCSAACVERGASWIGVQHGGNYGMLEYHQLINHEIAICDRFITWGWTLPDPAVRFSPLPSSKLSSHREIARDPAAEDVLFISNNTSRYFTRLQEDLINFSDYLEWQMRFVDALDRTRKNHLLVRLHHANWGWDQEHWWRDRYPEIRCERGGRSFIKSLGDCRICIADYLSTTYAESLSLDIPTIVFWDPDRYILRPEAEVIYDKLRQVGILHDSPESAAAMVNRIYDQVEVWWTDPETRSARKSLCETYALRSPNVLEAWKNLLVSASPLGD